MKKMQMVNLVANKDSRGNFFELKNCMVLVTLCPSNSI